MNCTVCELVVDSNALHCNASCGKVFHIGCLKPKNTQYKDALMPYINRIPNLRWFCDSCIVLPFNTQPSIVAELTKQLNDIKSFVDTLLTTLNSSKSTTQIDVSLENSEASAQIDHSDGNSNGSFASANSHVPMDQSPPEDESPRDLPEALFSGNIHIRQKRQLPPSPGMSPNSKHQKVTVQVAEQIQPKSLAELIAKKTPAATAAPNVTIKTNMIRSIHMSPFDPATESSHILAHLEANEDLKHIAPNITCKKLARKNQRVTFVSFKLDVPRHHYDIIVNPAIWPKNGSDEITIKEFVDKRKDKSATKGGQNPFKQPADIPHRKGQQHPTNDAKSKGGRNMQSNRAHVNASQQQSGGQGFQYQCQKPCCNRPKPRFNRYRDHYEENRYGRRQTYRR